MIMSEDMVQSSFEELSQVKDFYPPPAVLYKLFAPPKNKFFCNNVFVHVALILRLTGILMIPLTTL